MSAISRANAQLLREHIPKILYWIKENEQQHSNYRLPLRTLSWVQIDFYNSNNKASLQDILDSVDILMEAFYPVQDRFTLLM